MNTVPQIALEVQGGLVKLQFCHNLPKSSQEVKMAKRGSVETFSRKSRKRLLEFANRIDIAGSSRDKPIVFITLTYGQWWANSDYAKKHLRAFLERLRRCSPDASGIWRVEGQSRGAPHFHLLLFNLKYIPKEDISSWWAEIVGTDFLDYKNPISPRAPFTRIEAITNPSKVMRYVSKYVAKMPEKNLSEPAAASDFERRGAAAGGFNYVPYLHEPCPNPAFSEWSGRHWGIFNKDKIPFAEAITIVLDMSSQEVEKAFFSFRRSMKTAFKNARFTRKYAGMTLLFRQNSRRWHELFLYYVLDHIRMKT